MAQSRLSLGSSIPMRSPEALHTRSRQERVLALRIEMHHQPSNADQKA